MSIRLFLAVVLLASPATAQIELLPGRLPINEAVRWELAMGSIPQDTSLYHQPPDYYSQPLIFKRTAGKFKPYATVQYHFSRVDSLPFRIEYDWDANGHITREQWGDRSLYTIEPMSRLAEYDAEYTSLRRELVERYGEPLYGGSEVERVRGEGGFYTWSRGDRWEREGMMIDMYMFFADSVNAGAPYLIRIDQKWQ